jgi:hypothetical protein
LAVGGLDVIAFEVPQNIESSANDESVVFFGAPSSLHLPRYSGYPPHGQNLLEVADVMYPSLPLIFSRSNMIFVQCYSGYK